MSAKKSITNIGDTISNGQWTGHGVHTKLMCESVFVEIDGIY